MQLASAVLVFIISNYLKAFALVTPLCSLWRYYNNLRPLHILFLESILVLVLSLIMFASISLTRIDCNGLASYLVGPVLLGLGFLNAAHYWPMPLSASGQKQLLERMATQDDGQFVGIVRLLTSGSFVDSFQLMITNGLTSLALVQVLANSFGAKLSKILS